MAFALVDGFGTSKDADFGAVRSLVLRPVELLASFERLLLPGFRRVGQAILTFRALAQSDRFDHGWALVAKTYKRNVAVPENVVSISSARMRRHASI